MGVLVLPRLSRVARSELHATAAKELVVFFGYKIFSFIIGVERKVEISLVSHKAFHKLDNSRGIILRVKVFKFFNISKLNLHDMCIRLTMNLESKLNNRFYGARSTVRLTSDPYCTVYGPFRYFTTSIPSSSMSGFLFGITLTVH
jgi:hypothetical protein